MAARARALAEILFILGVNGVRDTYNFEKSVEELDSEELAPQSCGRVTASWVDGQQPDVTPPTHHEQLEQKQEKERQSLLRWRWHCSVEDVCELYQHILEGFRLRLHDPHIHPDLDRALEKPRGVLEATDYATLVEYAELVGRQRNSENSLEDALAAMPEHVKEVLRNCPDRDEGLPFSKRLNKVVTNYVLPFINKFVGRNERSLIRLPERSEAESCWTSTENLAEGTRSIAIDGTPLRSTTPVKGNRLAIYSDGGHSEMVVVASVSRSIITFESAISHSYVNGCHIYLYEAWSWTSTEALAMGANSITVSSAGSVEKGHTLVLSGGGNSEIVDVVSVSRGKITFEPNLRNSYAVEWSIYYQMAVHHIDSATHPDHHGTRPARDYSVFREPLLAEPGAFSRGIKIRATKGNGETSVRRIGGKRHPLRGHAATRVPSKKPAPSRSTWWPQIRGCHYRERAQGW